MEMQIVMLNLFQHLINVKTDSDPHAVAESAFSGVGARLAEEMTSTAK